jgi:hypothetical protein
LDQLAKNFIDTTNITRNGRMPIKAAVLAFAPLPQ